ncbi:hypothetical protein VPHK469_0142 [Vibrio phage K469]
MEVEKRLVSSDDSLVGYIRLASPSNVLFMSVKGEYHIKTLDQWFAKMAYDDLEVWPTPKLLSGNVITQTDRMSVVNCAAQAIIVQEDDIDGDRVLVVCGTTAEAGRSVAGTAVPCVDLVTMRPCYLPPHEQVREVSATSHNILVK